jgi:predicted metal-dependent HD superfamily phosphohydrolase
MGWDTLEAEARRLYAGPGRVYHGVAHLDDVLARFAEVAANGPGWVRPDEVRAALLFHDAVYVPGAKDNEARSATLARAALARELPGLDAPYVAALIELTARHGHLAATTVSPEEALFLDCDMAVLGADADSFDAYDRGVAAEYEHLPRELYAAGRRAFLSGLLAAPRIFLSPFWRERRERRARENLERALLRV